jgi:hypothetical protein
MVGIIPSQGVVSVVGLSGLEPLTSALSGGPGDRSSEAGDQRSVHACPSDARPSAPLTSRMTSKCELGPWTCTRERRSASPVVTQLSLIRFVPDSVREIAACGRRHALVIMTAATR